jgi:hypothetical protein
MSKCTYELNWHKFLYAGKQSIVISFSVFVVMPKYLAPLHHCDYVKTKQSAVTWAENDNLFGFAFITNAKKNMKCKINSIFIVVVEVKISNTENFSIYQVPFY